MTLPSFKKININAKTVSELQTQLSLYQLDRAPFVFDISHRKDQHSALDLIENYLSFNRKGLYPLCLLCTDDIFSEELIIIKSLREAPRFFRQKIKNLNLKENNLLNKIKLQQDKIYSLNKESYDESLKEFSKSHSEIKKLQSLESFIALVLDPSGTRGKSEKR